MLGGGSAAFAAAITARDAGRASNALLGADRGAEYRGLPRVTFSTPQIAGAGLTEAQSRDADHEVRTSVLELEHVPRALVNRETRGIVKLIADAASGRLLGASMGSPTAPATSSTPPSSPSATVSPSRSSPRRSTPT